VIRTLLAVPLLLLSCALPPPTPRETIKIVSLLPRTGSAKRQTDFIVNAIRLAIEDSGSRAGDFRVVFEDIDTRSATGNWGGGREDVLAPEIDRDPDVMAVIGTYNSGSAKIFMPVFNQSNLLMISPANTWPGLTKPGKGDPDEPGKYRPGGRINYCRVVPADDVQGLVAAEWANKSGAKRVFVIHDRETYGKGVAECFRKRAKEIGLEVLGFEGFDYEAQDFKSLLAKIKSSAPDLVYCGGTTQTKAGEITREMRAAGLPYKFMVPDGCFEESFITAAGAENLEGRLFITFGIIPMEKVTEKGAEFVRNYKNKYGQDPEFYAVYAYDAARVVLEAIRRAGKKDRDAIRAACLAIRHFDGALGTWSFDENGDTTLRTVAVYQVRNGKFEFAECVRD